MTKTTGVTDKTATFSQDEDLITLDDRDEKSAGVETLTVDLYGNDTLEAEDTRDIIVIEDAAAAADVVYGSSNSCLPLQVGTGNDTITGEEEGPIDIITSADGAMGYDDLELLDLTIGEDKDANAAYGGSNSCEPYAGDNTCEPPDGEGRAELTDLQITPSDTGDGVF